MKGLLERKLAVGQLESSDYGSGGKGDGAEDHINFVLVVVEAKTCDRGWSYERMIL